MYKLFWSTRTTLNIFKNIPEKKQIKNKFPSSANHDGRLFFKTLLHPLPQLFYRRYGPVSQPSVSPNSSVRICLKKLKISLLYYMKHTFGNNLFLDIRCCKKRKEEYLDFFESIHCVKSVQKRSFFWSLFSRIRTESISPYSVWMRENTDQKKLRIKTLFT